MINSEAAAIRHLWRPLWHHRRSVKYSLALDYKYDYQKDP